MVTRERGGKQRFEPVPDAPRYRCHTIRAGVKAIHVFVHGPSWSTSLSLKGRSVVDKDHVLSGTGLGKVAVGLFNSG